MLQTSGESENVHVHDPLQRGEPLFPPPMVADVVAMRQNHRMHTTFFLDDIRQSKSGQE